MMARYKDYLRSLEEIIMLPARTSSSLEEARQTHDQAIALADQAVGAADVVAAESFKTIEAQLAEARTALNLLDRANLVPPQIRASGGIATASRDDVAMAYRTLASAVHQLRQAVESEIKRIKVEDERRSRESAERARLAQEAAERAAVAAARRKKLIRLGMIGVVLLVFAIVILAVVF